MSKTKAFDAWKKLTADERVACSGAVSAYKAFLASKPDHPVMHATTFINERRFEALADRVGESATRQIGDDDWQKRLTYGRSNLQWHVENWGPIPGSDGCRVPHYLLQPQDGQSWTVWEA